jgi:phage-related tail fiber protein
MHRVKRAGNYANIPAPPAGGTPGYFGPGDPGTNTPATIPGYDWFNAVQEEICGPIEYVGDTLDEDDRTQLRRAIEKIVGVGAVMFFARNTAPTGWLKANGAAVSRTTYADLFAAIGTTFGAGDGSTTFNVPDLRGEFLRGWDDGRGVDSGRVFGSAQSDLLKSHNHAVVESASLPTNSSNDHEVLLTENTTLNGQGAYPNTTSTGGAETRPRNIALLACIKY